MSLSENYFKPDIVQETLSISFHQIKEVNVATSHALVCPESDWKCISDMNKLYCSPILMPK